MKTFDYYRHGHKNGNNISQEGLKTAIDMGAERKENYNYGVGGNESRTWQTLCAFLSGYFYHVNLIAPIANFGDGTLFKSWQERGFADAVKRTGSNIQGIKAILKPDEFQAACARALAGVVEVFAAIEHGESCIGFGHSPIIEMAAIAAGMPLEAVPALKELEGLRFIHHGGTITVQPLQ